MMIVAVIIQEMAALCSVCLYLCLELNEITHLDGDQFITIRNGYHKSFNNILKVMRNLLHRNY